MILSHEDIALVIPTVSTVVCESTPEAEANDMTDPEKMQFIIIGILGTIIIVFGTFGNIISIIVWTRRSMRSTTGTYLIALAGANSGHLLFFFFTDGIQILCPEIKKASSYGLFYSYVGFPLFMLFVSCSAWVTVGMTEDRCIKVCWINLAQVGFLLFYSCPNVLGSITGTENAIVSQRLIESTYDGVEAETRKFQASFYMLLFYL